MRKTPAALSLTVCALAVTAPAALARTVTLTKTYTLKSNATTTYTLPGRATSLSDAGYVLTGPGFKVRENNLVDPFPQQGHHIGDITRGQVKVLAVGTKTEGFGFQVRVKTGSLRGSSYRITLYSEYAA